MHTLEFCLLALSERIRHETGNEKLADTASQLAGESHQYVPETGHAGPHPALWID